MKHLVRTTYPILLKSVNKNSINFSRDVWGSLSKSLILRKMIEIEDSDLQPPLGLPDESFFRWNVDEEVINVEKFNGRFSVLRHKVVSSPIANAIYRVKLNVNKPLGGLELEKSDSDGTILTKDMLKELQPLEPDSFDLNSDDFEDLEGEMLRFTSKPDGSAHIDRDAMLSDQQEELDSIPELEEVLVVVQNSSIKINNEFMYEFDSTIRASRVLEGHKLREGIYDEDSLLITLTNGYLLLIKFYSVHTAIKPYVVQWWKTSSKQGKSPQLTDVGKEIITHSSGKAAILTSMKDLIRLHYFKQTPRGVKIDRLQNIMFDGIILHCALIEPCKYPGDSRAFIFMMVITSEKRYLIRLFEWWLDEIRVMEHTPVRLNADFLLPVFTIPVNDGILLVSGNKLTVLTINQLLSADKNYLEIDYDGFFPTSYFKPKEPLFGGDQGTEVFISAEDGSVHIINIDASRITITPILKVPKLTHFILEKEAENAFNLIFSSELSLGGYYRFENLMIDKEVTFPKHGAPVDKWINWAPLFDIEIVKKDKSEEIWLAHGKSLSKLKIGLPVDRIIADIELRKAEKVFHHFMDDDLYFIFSFVDHTSVLKLEGDGLRDIVTSHLDLEARTIHVSSVDNVCFQITERSFVVADFENGTFLRKQLDDHDIIHGDCCGPYTALLAESKIDGSISLSIYQSALEIFEVGNAIVIREEPNLIKFLKVTNNLYLVLVLSEKLVFYEMNDGSVEEVFSLVTSIIEPNDLVASNGILYISSRLGEYAAYDIQSIDSFHELYKVKLTNEPIDFYLTEDYIILISKYLWKLETGTRNPIPLVIDEQRDVPTYSAVILNDRRIALLRYDGFSIASLGQNPSPILKTVKLNGLAKKVKYLEHLKLFAVLTERELLFANKMKQLAIKTSGPVFETEVPLCITEWIVREESGKSYRQLVVGCNTSSGGSLKFIQLKAEPNQKDSITIRKVAEFSTEGSVLSVQQLGDYSIVFSSGYELFTLSYNRKTSKLSERKFVKRFNSLILSIDVQLGEVLISTKDYSITRFGYFANDENLYDRGTDNIVRKISNSLLLEQNVAVVANKLDCSITGRQNNETRFKTNVPFIPKLKKCQLKPTWWYDTDKEDSLVRFIAFGLSGDIQVYTLLDKDQTEEYRRLYQSSHGTPEVVTDKGFWEIKEGPWSDDINDNVFDHDKFDPDKISEGLKGLLNSVSI